MTKWENDYLELLHHVRTRGNLKSNRTGIDTLSIFDSNIKIDMSETFPVMTTKKLQWKAVVSELLWFIEGSTNERRLAEIHYGDNRKNLIGKKTIWTANADKQGKELGYKNTDTEKELGPIYGYNWRNWDGRTDQFQNVINKMKSDPDDRRHIVSSWNYNDIHKMALPPCHDRYQFYIHDNTLSLKFNMRSTDIFLGLNFNISSYALLLHMVASHLDMNVGTLSFSGGDTHVYINHFDAIDKQLSRTPLKNKVELDIPKIESFDIEYIKSLDVNDFKLVNYEHQGVINAPMAA